MRQASTKMLGLILCPLWLLFIAQIALAQTTQFTYQGKLTDGATPASGTYEMEFKLFDALTGGTQQPQPVPITIDLTVANGNPVTVTGGIFSVKLDFSVNSFTGANRWLEIAVRKPTDPPGFTVLNPRQPITSSPFSIKTLRASSADSLSAACVGCVSDANIAEVDGGKVTGSVASAATAVDVTGVVQIANGGTGSATKDFVDLSTNQDIDGKKTFIFPISGSGSQLTNLNGANLGNGSVTTPKLADGSVTQPKLAYGAANKYDLQLLGMLRWDLLPTPRVSNVGSNPRALAFDGTFCLCGEPQHRQCNEDSLQHRSYRRRADHGWNRSNSARIRWNIYVCRKFD